MAQSIEDTTRPRISLNEEYRLLHEVADTLQAPGDTRAMLQQVMRILTGFSELNVESKAGVFLADNDKRTLRLYATFGDFTEEFLEKEQEVPFGDCLCGRAAESGELLMSDSCFTDQRHERRFEDMTPHGHYIIPLKSRDRLVGILFLYTETHPTWYRFSQEVLLSIGALIAAAIERQLNEEELDRYRQDLESIVRERTAELMDMREQLRRLNGWMEDVREEEKKRIAREVHDQLGQSLTALSLDIAWLGRQKTDSDPAISGKLDAMQELVTETIDLTQKIASELRPQVLDLMGLPAAIEWQARQFTLRTGIECQCEAGPPCRDADSKTATVVFRIFQEALTNISRHARAKEVQVTLECREDGLELTVSDDGCGFDPQILDAPDSLGLMGMRERVRMLNGVIEFDSELGCGTTVRVTLPVSEHGV